MNNNVMSEYVKYVNNTLVQLYKLLLGNKYSAPVVRSFISKYIDVRYYNNTVYRREKDFVTRISKELTLLSKSLIKEEEYDIETIKNVNALFGYILYFDDVVECDNVSQVVKLMLNDTVITLNYDDSVKDNVIALVKDFNEKKKKYLSLFETKEFELKFKRVRTNVYKVDIAEYCNISKLYSEYAIETAFNTGTLAETKLYLMYVMLSAEILKDAIKLEFNKKYIVPFPEGILRKTKKSLKYYESLDNEYIKSKVNLVITYTTYRDNLEEVNKIINNGYNFTLRIDNNYKNDINCLVLFNYCLISEESDYYESLMESKDEIKTIIITE